MASLLSKVRTKLLPNIGERRAAQFYREQGAGRLIEFDLSPADTVAEIGGFTGDWASDMATRYNCRVVTTEPIKVFADEMLRRFAGNPKVAVQQIGVGNSNRTETMHILGAGSSAFRDGGTAETVSIVDAAEWAERLPNPTRVLAVNCEGAEYEILPRLIESGEIKRFDNVLVQFHETRADAEQARQGIRASLAATHREVFAYPFVWELWTRDANRI